MNKLVGFTIALAATSLMSAVAADIVPSLADLKRGLVLYYNFDTEPVAAKIKDQSGTGNDGEAVGAKWVAEGHRGGAYQFTPRNQFVRVPNSTSLNPSQITLAVWIKTSRKGNVWRRVIDKDYKAGYSLTVGGGAPNDGFQGRAFFEVNCRAEWAKNNVGSDAVVNDGQWHQLVGTFGDTEQRIYVDGRLQRRRLSNRGAISTNGYDLTLGLNPVNPIPNEVGESFDGLMDDIMIFNRKLSDAEVKTLFESQGGVLAPEPATISPAAFPASKPTAAERLKQVKTLFDQGLISKEDYDKKVKEIMDSL